MYFSTKNKKLVPNDSIEYAIWSLPAVATCPQSTELCRKSCYALKAERLYPSVKQSRWTNYDDSRKTNFIGRVIEYLDMRLAKKSHIGKTLIVRIHESGDFYSQDYYDMWDYIAWHYCNKLKCGRTDIVFMAYTKSIQFITQKPTDLILRFSVWNDTNKYDVLHAITLDIPLYEACSKESFTKVPSLNKCLCVDCSTCLKCYNNNTNDIVVAIH